MLTSNSFDCGRHNVRERIINGKPHWVYLGNSLAECIRFARKVQESGEYFLDPLTMEIMGAHHTKLALVLPVLLLVAMDHYHRFNDMKTIAYPEEFPYLSGKAARGFTADYNYLVHFGLLDKGSENVNSDDCVHYRVTALGRAFIGGMEIRTELFNI